MPSVGSVQHPSHQAPPRRVNALHVPQARRHGAAAGVVAPPCPQAGLGSNKVRGGSHPAPRTPLRCVPLVCHPYLRRVSPKPLWNPGRGPHRSVVTATFDGPHPAEPVLISPQEGVTPVIVLTRACGRVAPVTRGSDVLACGFPDGARIRRTGPLPSRSRDGSPGIRSAGRQPPRTEFHAFSLAQT